MALPVHRARKATSLDHRTLSHIAREFVGFGIAPPADVLLKDEPHSVTLVFSDKLLSKQVLEFPFAWPQSLVNDDGGCRGRVDLTLCYTPPIDPQHKDEAIRVQLEAQLSQFHLDTETGEEEWRGQLEHDRGRHGDAGNQSERALIRNGLKWAPLKRYHLSMKKGRGTSSDWKLSLHSLLRAGESFPSSGVSFSLILTISDSAGKAQVGQEMRQALQSRGLLLADITVAHRVRPRSR